jgi:hypothetical protein
MVRKSLSGGGSANDMIPWELEESDWGIGIGLGEGRELEPEIRLANTTEYSTA